MRRFTFLPAELIYIFLFIWIYAFWNWSFGYKALTSIILLTVFYALRRSSIPYRDTLKNNGEIFLSPVHGIVQSIRRDTSVWDDALWSAGDLVTKTWYGVTGLGFSGSVNLSIASQGIDFKWTSTDYVMEKGGVL